MNRVFLSGKLRVKPEVLYTPKGERVVMFPLWVEEGAFSIDVVFIDQQGIRDFEEMVGSNIMISGVLKKTMVKSPVCVQRTGRPDVFSLKANKILWMEE